jgi:hypothetical protein
MIKPHKYMDLKLSIVNISYIIMQMLKQQNKYSYDQMYKLVCAEIKEEGIMELFNLSLTFLFAFNKIEYNKDFDLVELLQ